MPRADFDQTLITRYDTSGPRYTSYPTAAQFTEEFSRQDYLNQMQQGNQAGGPVSLYFHLPFCDTICFYCACNKVVTKNRSRAAPYLERLHREIEIQSELIDSERPVDQLHWGGGTPTFIDSDQMSALMQKTRDHFKLHSDDSGEYSIEIDPREANSEIIGLLRSLGFNRISLGVQDFNPQVQKAVNRIQSFEQTQAVIQAARDNAFHSVSIDLIYGLPHQTQESFHQTLQTVLELGPDRLSVFNYAHLPELFKTQRQINADDLPSPQVKLDILHDSIETLIDAGYQYIGMDHFARPDDELARAQENHTLYRNFQGYSTHSDCDLIGLGVTSIGKVHDCYSQNYRTLDEYYAAIDDNRLAVFRGIILDDDDTLRREIITQLICHFSLSIPAIEQKYAIRFYEYFQDQLQVLHTMQADGLITVDENSIEVTAKGCLLIRNICMVFDKYLSGSTQRFSKVI